MPRPPKGAAAETLFNWLVEDDDGSIILELREHADGVLDDAGYYETMDPADIEDEIERIADSAYSLWVRYRSTIIRELTQKMRSR